MESHGDAVDRSLDRSVVDAPDVVPNQRPLLAGQPFQPDVLGADVSFFPVIEEQAQLRLFRCGGTAAHRDPEPVQIGRWRVESGEFPGPGVRDSVGRHCRRRSRCGGRCRRRGQNGNSWRGNRLSRGWSLARRPLSGSQRSPSSESPTHFRHRRFPPRRRPQSLLTNAYAKSSHLVQGLSIGRAIARPCDDMPHVHLALALDVDRALLGDLEIVLDELAGRSRDLDRAALAL